MISLDDLASSNQADDNLGTDEKGEDETVHGVPLREPSANCGASVCEVEEVEVQELSDQGVFDRHENCWPCNCGSNDSVDIPTIAVISTITSIFEAPVDSSKERNNLRCASAKTEETKQGMGLTTAPYPI